MTVDIGSLLAGAELIELGQPLAIGAPRYPSHPPFMYSLTSRHDERLLVLPGQDASISGASDAFAMGVHTGTHIDSLTHCAIDGCLHDGTNVAAAGMQDDARGIQMLHTESLRAIVAPGILLDFPGLLGVERVPRDYGITAERLTACAEAQGVTIARGEVVLVRTGWDTLYGQPEEFLSMPLPGPTPDAARLLSAAGIVATGSDTMPYEQAPGATPLEVHAELLVRAGIFIMETLDLRELARRDAHRFLFAALPLRITGATGSPINPVAIIAGGSTTDTGSSQ
jgi:kynurenine formamidase